jgi:glycosyltransferase involved in cell wall biosynthesis
MDALERSADTLSCKLPQIRVAFFTHYSLLYGANRSLLNLIDGLGDCSVVPLVIVPEEGDLTAVLKKRNIEFFVFSMGRWIGTIKSEGNMLSRSQSFLKYQKLAARRLKQNINGLDLLIQKLHEWKIDIIYTNTSVIPIGAIASFKTRIPHVWHLREFVDLDYDFRFDWGNYITKLCINQATAKIAISKAIFSHFSRGFISKNYHIIYNGIARKEEFDLLYEQAKSLDLSRRERPFTFALVGKINAGKGQDVAIRALSLLPAELQDSRLLIVGEGEDKPLKDLVGKLGLSDRVEFLGQVEDPFQAYLASDAVLMCSRSEGMGRVTVEAMAACRPVIGYDNAGTSEIILHEQTGLLYKGGEAELALSMQRLIANPKWGRELGVAGWQNAREEYCVEKYSIKVFEVLQSVLSSRHKSQQTLPV